MITIQSPAVTINITARLDQEQYQALIDRLTGIDGTLTQVIQKENLMAAELDTLKAQVASNTTVIGSAKDLIVGLKEKLDAAIASGDPAALTALSAELKSQDDALAAAVVANTPAATA